MAKTDNVRKFPGESGPRPDFAKAKQGEAKERQEYYDGLSPAAKLAKLDEGKFVAKKQRAKLAALVEKKAAAPVVAEASEKTEDVSEKKHLKAKERRSKEKK